MQERVSDAASEPRETDVREPKHVAPPEFGEGLAQFIVERSRVGANGALLPILIWVQTKPYKPSDLRWTHKLDCSCEFAYRLTSDSVDFLKSIPYQLADPTGDYITVCLCRGRFIE